jgi:TonB family protein
LELPRLTKQSFDISASVVFTLASDGRLSDVTLLQSSGDTSYDEALLAAFQAREKVLGFPYCLMAKALRVSASFRVTKDAKGYGSVTDFRSPYSYSVIE